MSDHDWSKEAIFDSPQVRHDVQQAIKIELPPQAEAARVAAPPVPSPAQDSLRAVLDNPQLAAQLWAQVDEAPSARPEAPARPPEHVVVQLGLALYFLHALHFQGKPGREHLVTTRTKPRDEEDDELDTLRS